MPGGAGLLAEGERDELARELLATDQPGFRERYGYHNDADHSQEQRYGF